MEYLGISGPGAEKLKSVMAGERKDRWLCAEKDSKCLLKTSGYGNSLAVQWLAVGTFTAVAWVQSLVGELRSCNCVVARPKEDFRLYD